MEYGNEPDESESYLVHLAHYRRISFEPPDRKAVIAGISFKKNLPFYQQSTVQLSS